MFIIIYLLRGWYYPISWVSRKLTVTHFYSVAQTEYCSTSIAILVSKKDFLKKVKCSLQCLVHVPFPHHSWIFLLFSPIFEFRVHRKYLGFGMVDLNLTIVREIRDRLGRFTWDPTYVYHNFCRNLILCEEFPQPDQLDTNPIWVWIVASNATGSIYFISHDLIGQAIR